MTMTEEICAALREIGVEATAREEGPKDRFLRIRIAEGPIPWVNLEFDLGDPYDGSVASCTITGVVPDSRIPSGFPHNDHSRFPGDHHGFRGADVSISSGQWTITDYDGAFDRWLSLPS